MLRKEYDLTCYFYNPNIQPRDEYEKRLAEARRYCSAVCMDLVEGEYDVDIWELETIGRENDPEGGERCRICYRLRLEKTAKQAAEKGFDIFSTTLTISPHKDAVVINSLGEDVARAEGVPFLSIDLKKRDGFKRSIELSHQHGLYRQDFCGCKFSRRK
jgi:predicted adenine nucleotide alpha hydrolase (AANH) superfamily ATPase